MSRHHDGKGAYPDGLPIGDAWEPTGDTQEVVFPATARWLAGVKGVSR